MIRHALRGFGWRDVCWLTVGLALIILMRRNLLDYEQQVADVPIPAAVGTRVVQDDFAVTVEAVRLAHRYRVRDTGSRGESTEVRVLQSPGLWVAVPLTLEMLRQPGYVGARLRTRDGFLYSANSDKRPEVHDINLAQTQLLPGLPKSGVLFFEVPAEKLAGVHLELFRGLRQSTLSAVIDMDLGIDSVALATVPDEVDLRQ